MIGFKRQTFVDESVSYLTGTIVPDCPVECNLLATSIMSYIIIRRKQIIFTKSLKSKSGLFSISGYLNDQVHKFA